VVHEVLRELEQTQRYLQLLVSEMTSEMTKRGHGGDGDGARRDYGSGYTDWFCDDDGAAAQNRGTICFERKYWYQMLDVSGGSSSTAAQELLREVTGALQVLRPP
jgi:hypothetical protein